MRSGLCSCRVLKPCANVNRLVFELVRTLKGTWLRDFTLGNVQEGEIRQLSDVSEVKLLDVDHKPLERRCVTLP